MAEPPDATHWLCACGAVLNARTARVHDCPTRDNHPPRDFTLPRITDEDD